MAEWEKLSKTSEARALKKAIPSFSYQDLHTSLATDEQFCALLTKELSIAKKLVYDLTDLLFSLKIGEQLLPKLDTLRDEIDIFSDEIKVRHCQWKTLPPGFLKKFISQDLILLKEVRALQQQLESIFHGILKVTKKKRPTPELWNQVKFKVQESRSTLHEMVIHFKERELLCNIRPLSLERTFKAIQKDVRKRA